MKFANIDDAITEAAKKPVPKVASPKADPKKAAPKKVAPKKVDPKETPASVAPTKKPAAPKKAAAPVAVPKKKATSSKVPKTVVKKKKSVAPAPAAEPETREEPATEPEQKPAEPKPTQGSDSSERPKFAPRWLQSKPRGIGDRLKSAWKGFTAKSGQDLGKAGTSYKSVFHEIHKLMEQLQLVEAMLQEQSLNESYDAGTVNNLYEHRNTIRSVLVEQIVREELYMHNVTIAELDQRQRAALMETVNVRANALWEGLEEAESEEEYDPNSFETSADHIERSTTPQDDDDDDYDTVNYSNWDMPESYTLEEWMGMMEEAGYSLDEKNMNQMTRDERDHAIASARDVVQKKVKGTSPADVKAAQHAATVAQLLKRLGRAQTGTPEMEEGKLSRLAAGLGLAGAAMMGSPNDAGAQGTGREPLPVSRADSARIVNIARDSGDPDAAADFATRIGNINKNAMPFVSVQPTDNDSVSTVTGKNVDRVTRAAQRNLAHRGISPDNASTRLSNKPDASGNYTVTVDARKQPKSGAPQMEDKYTLEEWMGMMEESGVNLNELSPETLARYGDAARKQQAATKDKYQGTVSPSTGQKYDRDMLGMPPEADAAGDARKIYKRAAGISQANTNLAGGRFTGGVREPGISSTERQARNMSPTGRAFDKINNKGDSGATGQYGIDRERASALRLPKGQPKMAAESINENTVARLQQLAGIKPIK